MANQTIKRAATASKTIKKRVTKKTIYGSQAIAKARELQKKIV